MQRESEVAATLLETITAAWNARPRCEIETAAGRQCRRAASWKIDLHGCEQAIACGQHCRRWLAESLQNFALSDARCAHCGRVFDTPAGAFLVAAL